MDALGLRRASAATAGVGPGSAALAAPVRPQVGRIGTRRTCGNSISPAAAVPRVSPGGAAPRRVAAAASPGPQQQQQQQQQPAPYVEIPASQEDAVQQAAEALAPQLKPLLSASGGAPAKKAAAKKGFGAAKPGGGGGGGYQRFAVELPVADTSPAATAKLAQDLLRQLPGQPGAWTVVFADDRAAAAGRGVGLREACRAQALGGPLLIVAPAVAEVALAEQLVQEVWSGPAAVVLNPAWSEGVPREFEAVVRSFEVAYSFLPISIKGLVGGKEGAVLRRAPPRGGGLAAAPWQILAAQRDGRFQQIGQMKKRPTQSDLELVFMNASAAASPLTGAVKSAKTLFDRVRGGGGGGQA